MTKREIKTVTQCGMVSAQPGTSVGSSHFHGSGVHVLNASRYYPDMPNAFGGKGVFKKLDCDGMEFSTREAAHQFALERGYTREYFTEPSLRARNVENGATLKARAIEFKKRLADGTLFKKF
jgi:hypothetical protein